VVSRRNSVRDKEAQRRQPHPRKQRGTPGSIKLENSGLGAEAGEYSYSWYELGKSPQK
jgi:hypothetical protein